MGGIRYSGRALEIYNTLNAITSKNLGASSSKINKNKDLKLFFEASTSKKPSTNSTKVALYDINTVRFADFSLNSHYCTLKGSASWFINNLTNNKSLNSQEIFKQALEISYGAVNSPLNSHFSGIHSMALPAFTFVVSNQSRVNSLEIAKLKFQHNNEYSMRHFGIPYTSGSCGVLDYFDVDSPLPTVGSFNQVKSNYYYNMMFENSGITVSNPKVKGLRSDFILTTKDKKFYVDVKRQLKPIIYEFKDEYVQGFIDSNTNNIQSIVSHTHIFEKIAETWDKDSYPSGDHVLMVTIDDFPKDRSELKSLLEYQQLLNEQVLPELKSYFPNIPKNGIIAFNYTGAPPPDVDKVFIDEVHTFNKLFVEKGFSGSPLIDGVNSTFFESLKLEK